MSYFNIGEYSRSISTSSEEAQQWFDRGLTWVYAYHHEEAIVCFERALVADPMCAMALWGIAYAIGPNYNKPWADFDDSELRDAIQMARDKLGQAIDLAGQSSAVERALIEALVQRYPKGKSVDNCEQHNDLFADAMRKVYRTYSNDLDVCCLFAEALMNRTPWQLWNLTTGQVAQGASTQEAIDVLDAAFRDVPTAWQHPGLLHMYIHLMEMSPHPERALRHGDALYQLTPDAGHLLHMPTHIDVLCGDYSNVVERNHAAIKADKKYLADAGADNFYTIYRCHNYHFKIYGALFLGQKDIALTTADELIVDLTPAVITPMADWLEAFIPMKQHVLIRFGLWNEILEQVLPDDTTLYSVTIAMMRYARTIALANLQQFGEAEAEQQAFIDACANVPDSRMLFNNTCHDLLNIASKMVLGELRYHQGEHEQAFQHLRDAIQLDDNLPYDEPWGWMQPVRHALGALLLEQGQLEEAEAIYRADLGLDSTLSRACQHPGNVWSLHGLRECLQLRKETTEAAHIEWQLRKAQARCDVDIKASCYCRGVKRG
ncbi:MAG: hypothetical protein AB8B48_11435 [Pseudomonadales bacterium]